MRRAPLALVLGLAVIGVTACSDDAEAPPVTGSEAAFCEELRAAVTDHVTIFDPLQPTTADDTEAATARLADAAPAEVSDPMRLLADTFAEVAAVLDRYGATDPEAATALEELDIDQAAITEAQEAVSAYAVDACGIDLEAMNAASVTTSTSVPGTTVPPATTAPTTVPPVDTTVPPVTG